MGKINSRNKGSSGERQLIQELGELLGLEMKRNLEQTRMGGHDILGLPGWALEVKRYAKIRESDLERFWAQAVEQALLVNAIPALAYREDFRSWRMRVPLELMVNGSWTGAWPQGEWTADLSLNGFATVFREHQRSCLLISKPPETLPQHSDEACASAQ